MRTLDTFLLTRRWYDGRDGLRFVFWCAAEEGPVRVVMTGQQAVMFVPRRVVTQGGVRKELELKTLTGEPVDALYFRKQRALRDERQRIRDDFGRTHEGDVKPHNRFLMERFVTGGMRIRGKAIQRDGFVEFIDPKVKACEYEPTLSLLSLDIETDGLDGELLSIACAGAGGNWVGMRGSGPPIESIHYAPDEAALIRLFAEHVRTVDPDVLLGWNVVGFDLDYLVRKSTTLGVPLLLGRDASAVKIIVPQSDRQPMIARVEGRVVLDGIATLRAATFRFESFRLDDVASTLIGRRKKIDHDADPVAEIRRLFAEDKQALAEYNLEDCQLVLDIFEAADLVGFAVERQTLTGLPMERQGGAVAAFDNLYLPHLHRRAYVAPDVGDSKEEVTSPGGYVLDSEPGLYRNVLVLDFKSLYPSIIRTFAIDPMGLAFPGSDPIPGFVGGMFSRDAHILPAIIETLWSARDDAKQRKDHARSRAIKILMNSFYGVLGTPGCRFFDPKLASSITLRGHEIIMESRRFVEERGVSVIYGDTDSLFVWVGDRSEEDADQLGVELAASLNRHWTHRLARELRLESKLEVEYETHYLRFLMPTMRGSDKGSKKRYAGAVRNDDGTLGVVIKGLEAIRTDWTPLARRLQRELFVRVFNDEPWRDWLVNLAKEMRAGALDAELVYKKRLRRHVDEYEKNVPPHVQAAKKLGRDVREIRYVITKRGAEPAESAHASLDYAHYMERQLAPAADAILPFLGTDFVSLAGSQLGLFD